MKRILKILGLLVAISALWIALLHASIVPNSYAWLVSFSSIFYVLLLPVYMIISLGCYGLFMVGVGLIFFPTCPQESLLLQKDIAEARDFLKRKGIDVHSD